MTIRAGLPIDWGSRVAAGRAAASENCKAQKASRCYDDQSDAGDML